jgi:hypothetical protein
MRKTVMEATYNMMACQEHMVNQTRSYYKLLCIYGYVFTFISKCKKGGTSSGHQEEKPTSSQQHLPGDDAGSR